MGDVLNWNEAEWELSNVKRIDLDTSDFCIDFPEKNYFMIPERRSLESGYDVCHILGTVNQNSEFLSDIVHNVQEYILLSQFYCPGLFSLFLTHTHKRGQSKLVSAETILL